MWHVIEKLPGAPVVPFPMRSGCITVDEKARRAMFFWFVASFLDPIETPLTVWLNRRTILFCNWIVIKLIEYFKHHIVHVGCSSVGGGMLNELGPFYPILDGAHLEQNPHSWNKVFNMLFIGSPAGVFLFTHHQ